MYLFLLLYADDTIVLAECPEDLQRALQMLKILYCEVWGLDIDIRKTKVMIFSRGRSEKCQNLILMRKLLTFGIINIWE